MLNFDLYAIGNALLRYRKAKGLTQAEVAEKSDLSDRAYADIERGNVTMRIDSLLKICHALCITPNDVLTATKEPILTETEIIRALTKCSANEKTTAMNILNAYLDSIS